MGGQIAIIIVVQLFSLFNSKTAIAENNSGIVAYSKEAKEMLYTENGKSYRFIGRMNSANEDKYRNLIWDENGWYLLETTRPIFDAFGEHEGKLLGEFIIQPDGHPQIKKDNKYYELDARLQSELLFQIEAGLIPNSSQVSKLKSHILKSELPGITTPNELIQDGKSYRAVQFTNELYYPDQINLDTDEFLVLDPQKKRITSKLKIKNNGNIETEDTATKQIIPTKSESVLQLKNHILANVDILTHLNGNNRYVRFLKNYQLSDSPLNIDLSTGKSVSLPHLALSSEEITRHALNDLFNHLTYAPNVQALPKLEKNQKHIKVDITKYFDSFKKDLIEQAYPYACPKGKKETVRADWLIATLMDGTQGLYNMIMGLPSLASEYENKFQVSLNRLEEKTQGALNAFVPISEVAHGERILGVKPLPETANLNLHQSFDYAYSFNNPERKALLQNNITDIRNIADAPNSEAGEYIQDLPNGGFLFSAYLQNSSRVDFVDLQFVHDRVSGIRSEILNAVSCRHCHAAGLKGGDNVVNKDDFILKPAEFDADSNLKSKYKTFSEYVSKMNQLYSEKEDYAKYARDRNKLYIQFLKKADAFVASKDVPRKPVPLIPLYYKAYMEDLDLNQVVKELSILPEEAKWVMEKLAKEKPSFRNTDTKISRRDFERYFCLMKSWVTEHFTKREILKENHQ